jgi:hypothetical protein
MAFMAVSLVSVTDFADLGGSQIAVGGLKDADRFGESSLVRFTSRAIAIRLHPFRVLSAQVTVNFLLKLGVRMNFAAKRVG